MRLVRSDKCRVLIFASARLVIRVGRQGQSRTEEIIHRWNGNGAKPRITFRCDSSDSVKAAVRKGTGVGILYRDVIKEQVRRGEFKILELSGIDLTARSYIAYSKGKPLSRQAQDFLQLLRTAPRKIV